MNNKKLYNVKKGLELCLDTDAGVCTECPYYFNNGCSYILKADALALIKMLESKINFLNDKK